MYIISLITSLPTKPKIFTSCLITKDFSNLSLRGPLPNKLQIHPFCKKQVSQTS